MSIISSSFNVLKTNAQTKQTLTHAIIISHDKDTLKNRMQEDPAFKQTVYSAISFPPPYEFQTTLAKKVVEILPAQDYPVWVRQILPQILTTAPNPYEIEQIFLKQCASGTQLDLDSIKALKIDLTDVRDPQGRTGIQLLLLNPSAMAENFRKLITACPQLMFVKDFDQNLPLDLKDQNHPHIGLIFDLYLENCSNASLTLFQFVFIFSAFKR